MIPLPALSARAWGAIGLLAVIIVLFAWAMRLNGLRAEYKGQRDVAVVKLEATAASANRLAGEMARVKAEQVALAAGDADRVRASKEALALAEAASEVRKAAIERLLTSAGVIRPEDACEVSDAVKELWK